MNLTQEIVKRTKVVPTGHKTFTVKIKAEQYRQFNDICKRLDLPMTGVVREVMNLFIEQNQKKKMGRPFGSKNKKTTVG